VCDVDKCPAGRDLEPEFFSKAFHMICPFIGVGVGIVPFYAPEFD
jgi:hypothetical protein